MARSPFPFVVKNLTGQKLHCVVLVWPSCSHQWYCMCVHCFPANRHFCSSPFVCTVTLKFSGKVQSLVYKRGIATSERWHDFPQAAQNHVGARSLGLWKSGVLMPTLLLSICVTMAGLLPSLNHGCPSCKD